MHYESAYTSVLGTLSHATLLLSIYVNRRIISWPLAPQCRSTNCLDKRKLKETTGMRKRQPQL